MRQNRLVVAAASLLVLASSAHAQRVDGTRPRSTDRNYGRAPEVEVWIDRYVFRSGERIRTYFETEPGAYVTILRVTTTGNVSILYPRRPTAQRPYRNDLVNDEIPFGGRREFYLNEPDGLGYVFAVASFEPFDYRAFNSGGQWTTTRLAGFGYGDPYRAVNTFVSRTLSERADYSTDYIQYQVIEGNRYDRYAYGSGYGYGSAYGGGLYQDQYHSCLRYYGLQAISYCRSFAGSGIGGFPYIVVRPPQTPAPTTPTRTARRPKMAPPGKIIPDPGVTTEAASSGQGSFSKYSGARERAASPRVIDNSENLRVERRQKPQPVRDDPAPYVITQPRNEPAPVQRYEAPQAPRLDPQAVRRYEPPAVQRNEPPAVQRYEPPAVQRYEPPAAQRYEAPRVEQRQEPRPAPVAREHPAPRVEPAPPPPPPPPAQ